MAVFLLQLTLATIIFSQTINGLKLPSPIGPYNTSLTIHELIDKNRLEAFSPTNQTRRLMISIFNPVLPCSCTATTVPYMDPLTAAYEDAKFSVYGLPAGAFSSLELQVCNPTSKSRILPKLQIFPVVVFSPSLGTSRLFYNMLAQQVASAGYTVVTVDHPYDVDIVTFPDNSTITEVDISDAQIPLAINTRVKDISFVLNQLARPSVAKVLVPGSTSGLEVSKVGVFGHSLGGAAAAEAMLYDDRLIGGVNLDGTFFSKVVQEGLKKPFLIFGHEGKDTTTDPSWAAIWPKLTGFKRELMLRGAQHYAFSDLVNVVEVLGIRGLLPDAAGEMLGSITGNRVSEVILGYVVDFFDMVIKGGEVGIFDGPSEIFPDVTFGNP